jgi:molecular chaperone GrpE
VGKKFDPHFHEILMQVDSSDHEEATVIEEFQKGYMLHELVIRTAKVKIAKRSETQQEPPKGTKEIPEQSQ